MQAGSTRWTPPPEPYMVMQRGEAGRQRALRALLGVLVALHWQTARHGLLFSHCLLVTALKQDSTLSLSSVRSI